MFKRILGFVRPYSSSIVTIALVVVVMAVVSQVEPFITKEITDTIVNQSELSNFTYIARLLAILLLVKLFLSLLNRFSWFMTNIFVIKLETHLKKIGFDHLMKLSLSFFNEQETGKVMSKLDRGVNRIVNIVNNSGMHFIPSVMTAIISFGIVLYYEWRIGLVTILAFIPYVAINRWRFNKNSILEKQEYSLYDEQYSHFWEVLNSMQLIKAFRAENFERARLKKFFKKYFSLRQKMERNTNKAWIGDVILELLNWSMYGYIVFLAWKMEITIGTMVLLVGLVSLIREPLWELNWIFWEVKRAQIGAKDFFRIIDIKSEVVDVQKPIVLTDVEGKIVFDQVSFTYKKNSKWLISDKARREFTKENAAGVEVFDQVSFVIEAKKTTAFIGPSGAGKSTIAGLIMRFFDPESGAISLDGVDIKKLSQYDLRSYMGLVSQDSFLFATTIEENLRYAKPTATIDEMWQACRVARADEFIKNLPQQLQTKIGDRGVKLSGGQRQRLSLARTILKNPKIIILDEATSSLDSESEMHIQKALQELLKNRTAIVIAHRLSTIQRADHIVVLKEKGLFEQGTHQELMKKDGLYASLFKIQSGDEETLKKWDLVA